VKEMLMRLEKAANFQQFILGSPEVRFTGRNSDALNTFNESPVLAPLEGFRRTMTNW
jgi:hypothetical protein